MKLQIIRSITSKNFKIWINTGHSYPVQHEDRALHPDPGPVQHGDGALHPDLGPAHYGEDGGARCGDGAHCGGGARCGLAAWKERKKCLV